MLAALSDRYNGAVAETAAEALAEVASVAALVSLILMNLALDGDDGLAVTRRLRANLRHAAIPVVALTEHAAPSDRSRVRRGMRRLLTEAA
jgi:CheY-like chemotaxis protein